MRAASLDRLAHSVVDLAQIGRSIRVEFATERLAFDPGDEDAFATSQLHLLGALAHLRRSLVPKR